jgi:hypothetical protein
MAQHRLETAREHGMKIASSRNVPCLYQGCALERQEHRRELIPHGSVKQQQGDKVAQKPRELYVQVE